jgi:nucleotide-binding universal stress UspA family protein
MACSLAEDYGARLLLFHVMQPSAAPLLEEPPPDARKSLDLQKHLKERFPWPQPLDPWVAVERRVAEGDAPDEIVRQAQESHCDLIVMGTQGRTGLSRMLLGSVAEEVLRRASCPVMAVKCPLPETSEAPPH